MNAPLAIDTRLTPFEPGLDGLRMRLGADPDPIRERPPAVRERVSLTELHGRADDEAVADLAYATIRHGYRRSLLDEILRQAHRLHAPTDAPRFLSLEHLRHAHDAIEEVRCLMHDPERLAFLSEVAGCRLEPYPIPTAGSHVNFYRPGGPTIGLHTDGCALVELIPLEITGARPDTATLISRDRPEPDRGRDRATPAPTSAPLRLRHELGQSVLLQGRSVLHSADALNGGARTTLVLPMRSADEPWKDDNTLFRLLQDDEPEDVVSHWVRDVVERQVPAYRTSRRRGVSIPAATALAEARR